MTRSTVFVAAVLLSTAGSALAQWGRGSAAALTVGFAPNGRTRVFGFCTDAATEQNASNCAVNDFIRKGGAQQQKSWQWSCKGWYAVAESPSGALGFQSCMPDKGEAMNRAINQCQGVSRGQVCQVTIVNPDLRDGRTTTVERNTAAEHSALVFGVGRDGRASVFGFCTDGKTAQDASNCAVNNFVSKGGSRQTKTWQWQCKGWYALAQNGYGGGMGFRSCAIDRNQAVSEAMQNCSNFSRGAQCQLIVAAPDRM